jgi:hypothetical protein
MEYLNKNLYKFNYARENIDVVINSVIAFFVPFLIGYPQLVVGIIINFMLIRSAYYSSLKKTLPVIILPSLAVFFRGMMFGNLTSQLLYLVPFIILGNFTLVFLSKQYFKNNKNILTNSLKGIIVKVAIIFAGTILVYALGLVPIFFLQTMASLQIVTALIALALFYGNVKLNKKLKFNV